MKKLLYFICSVPLLLSTSVSYAGPSVTNFYMSFGFTDANGQNEGNCGVTCQGDNLYLINRSTYGNGTNIQNQVTCGYYSFYYKHPSNGYWTYYASINADQWKGGEIWALNAHTPFYGSINQCVSSVSDVYVRYYPNTSVCSNNYAQAGPNGNQYQIYARVYAPPSINITSSSTTCAGSAVTLTATGGSSYVWNTGQTGNQITVYPTGNTTYTVTATNSAGCQGTKSITVNVIQPPTVNLGADVMLCSGDPIPTLYNHVPFNPFSNYSYKWYQAVGATLSTSDTYHPSIPGTYCLEITDNNTGCKNTDCVTIANDPYLLFNGNFTKHTKFYTGGTTYTVYATFNERLAGMSESWHIDEVDHITHAVITPLFNNPTGWHSTYNDGDGKIDFQFTNPSVTFHKDKTYRIRRIIWSDNGCLAPKTIDAIVYIAKSGSAGGGAAGGGASGGGATGPGKKATDMTKATAVNLGVYPNPTNGSVSISTDAEVTHATLQVFDITGKVVFEKSYESLTQSQVDLEQQPKGLYIIKVTTPDQIFTERVVKE